MLVAFEDQSTHVVINIVIIVIIIVIIVIVVIIVVVVIIVHNTACTGLIAASVVRKHAVGQV